MFDVHYLRQQFPALQRVIDGKPPVLLDGPGGTQVPQRVIDAMVHYLSWCNTNHGGLFTTSQESDALLHQAHAAMAHSLKAPSPAEIAFGPNMTTRTLGRSRAIGKTLGPGGEVVVSCLDYDCNFPPWVLAARDAGATIKVCDIHPEDCTL